MIFLLPMEKFMDLFVDDFPTQKKRTLSIHVHTKGQAAKTCRSSGCPNLGC